MIRKIIYKGIFQKLLIAFILVIISPIAAGLFGIVHDQFTYTISPEYYTKFKFIQFGLDDEIIISSPRLAVTIIGFYASWWTGIPYGIMIGLISLIQKNWKRSLLISLQCIGVTLAITLLSGLIGLLYGELFVSEYTTDFYLPSNIMDRKSFLAVGMMHNFSYLGGFIGLIASIVFQLKARTRDVANAD
jgi:hypothetical protein